MIVDPGNPGPDAPLVLVGPSPEHPDRERPGLVRLSPALRGLQPRVTASVAVLRVMVNDATHLEQGVHVVTMRRGMADDRDAMMLLEVPDLSVLSVVAAQALRENPLETGREARPPRDDDRENAPRHDDPAVDEDATPSELDRSAWRELKALTKENAEWVAGHLVMASRVVDEDPERAHKHALAASRRAGRIPVVRETVGITAYLLGDFALALRELRTYRRLSGSNDQVPMMVDCERGLGRPEKALELAGEVNRAELSAPIAVELAIARSGARLDLGQLELALQELEIPQLNPELAYSYSPALFDSYATILSLMGKEDEAEKWGELANRAAQALESVDDDGDDEVVVVEMPLEGEGD